MISTVIALVVLAGICEALWETVKQMIQPFIEWIEEDRTTEIDKVGAGLIGVILCLGTGLDLFTVIDLPLSDAWMGQTLTGLLISRGGSFIHDLLGWVQSIKTVQTQKSYRAIIETNQKIEEASDND